MGVLKKFFGKEQKEWVAFATGSLLPLSKATDPLFSSLSMGNGVAILPSSSEVVSPVTGEITMVFPTKHAFGLKTDEGIEILIHIGVDTVNLKGKGFSFYKKKNTKVKAGEKIADIDLSVLSQNGYDSTIMFIVTNSNGYSLVYEDDASVKSGESIIAKIKNEENWEA